MGPVGRRESGRRSVNRTSGGDPERDAQNHGTAAVVRANFKCSPSIHRYAKSVRTGRNLADALDGTGAPGYSRNSGSQSSANGFHPIYYPYESRRQTGALAAIFHQVGLRDPVSLIILTA